MLKRLLMATALGEAAFGVFVFLAPNLVFVLLFGSGPVAGAPIMTRIAGLALVGLGVACYPSGPRQGLHGLLTYGVLVTLYLTAVGIGGAAGVSLWPAIAVHAILSLLLIVAQRAPATGRAL